VEERKVNIDYHVEFDGHYYSVPHALVRTTVELRVTASMVECFAANQRVACHALSHRKGAHTTAPEHMPASHRAHLEWTPQKLIDWGRRIGVSAAAVVTWQLEHRPQPIAALRLDIEISGSPQRGATAAVRLAPKGCRSCNITTTFRSRNTELPSCRAAELPSCPASDQNVQLKLTLNPWSCSPLPN
jgi:hypothetical protein